MIFTRTSIPGVMVVDLEPRRDERGFFARQWCAEELTRAGLDPRIAQINTARSTAAGTLRGMHFQTAPHAEAKLVRCPHGAVFDVAVDLRPESETYCRWFGIELNADNGRMLYIPEGCAHGYLTLVPDTDLTYQASVPYAPGSATGVRHDDPAFGIVWPRSIEVLSKQDAGWKTL
ncbi:MAG TPA: dTDP-4-dehydrorhamnose 3,5-epimerase family protein [Steroidobacteraceae bacterium]|nr:dTDP-4-dehydrorhamnose 3,5-epimerase family protein [Steroidobacteraceae bacterium]